MCETCERIRHPERDIFFVFARTYAPGTQDEYRRVGECHFCPVCGESLDDTDAAGDAVAVAVVRCRDCRYLRPIPENERDGFHPDVCGMCMERGEAMFPGEYCSNGKRERGMKT